MIKGCREPPYPSILTDATMEKLALAKFVAQESKCEVSLVITTIIAGDENSQETPLTSPASYRPATWLCVSTASFTGKTPWMRHWDLEAAATPLQKMLLPRTASCTTRQAPPTWARSSGSPALWCSGGHWGCGSGLGSDRALGRRCWEQFAAPELLGRWRGLILPPKGAKPPVCGCPAAGI